MIKNTLLKLGMTIDGTKKAWKEQPFATFEEVLLHLAEHEPASFYEFEKAWQEVSAWL